MISQKQIWPLFADGRIVSGYGSGQQNMKTGCATKHRYRPGCHKMMTLATYNGRSLSSESRLQELEEELERIKWDIIGLCEVRRKGEERIELKSGHTLYYRGTKDGRTSGVGFLIHNRWKNHVVELDSSSDRVARIVIQLSKRYKIQIIQVYAPTTSHSDEEIEDFYEEVSKMNRNGNHYLKIIMGDLNARIGARKKGECSVGSHGYGARNDRGNRLVEFAECEKFFIMNSFFKKKPQRKWTWRSANGATSEIDYILTNKKYIIQDCSVLNNFNTGSDHRMVRCKLLLNTKIERMKLTNNAKKSINMAKLNECREQFQLELKNRFEVLKNVIEEEQDVNEVNKTLISTLRNVAEEIVGETATKPVKKITEETKELMRKRRELKPKKNDPKSKVEYAELCKTVRKRITEDVRKFNCDLVRKAVEDNKSLKTAKRQLCIGRKGVFALKRENGTITKNSKEIIHIVERFYNKLYKNDADKAENKEEEVERKEDEEAAPVVPVMEDEVCSAVKCMKKGKCPGEDGISVDIIAAAGEEVTKMLAHLFTKCLKKSDVPEDWKNAIMVLLFKKGEKENIKNYRPISLLSVMYKIFTKVLTNRIEGALDSAQPREQAGFRSGFSTIDHIQVIRQLIERHKEYEMPLCFAFIDFEKAFDSVFTSAVVKALESNGIEKAYINILKKIYSKATATICLGKGKAKIKLERGVRQGDTISPKLFTAVLEEVFRKLDWSKKGIKINGEFLSHLRFADDIVIISSNPNELEEMLTELAEASIQVGLKMNLQKTKIMFNAFASKKKIMNNSNEIEEVESYVYLGQEITMDNNIMSEINRRIKIGWSAFGKNNIILKSNMPLCLKKKVFNQCVLPSLTYGAETWTLSSKAIQRLQTTQRSMERCMLGITRRDRKRITWIRSQTKVFDVIERIKHLKWQWAGHIARRQDNRWTTRVLDWYPRDTKRPRKRPQVRWSDEIRKLAGVNWKSKASERGKWKSLEETFIQQWIENG